MAAAAMFAVVFAACQTSSDVTGAIALLYVVPISLVALELGLLAGVCCAVFALGLVGVWALGADADLGVVGMFTRGVAYVAVGSVAGRFCDRMRVARERQRLLLESGLTLAHVNGADDLSATLAQQARELVSCRGARVELAGTLAVESGFLGEHGEWQRVPIEVRGVRYGTLTVSGSTVRAEDRATLAILALQSAVAAENGRLLESERERVVIRAELNDARVRLTDRAGQLRELLVRQEAERHQVADELSEQAAQVLAAVLLGLAALERELGCGLATPRLGALRSDIHSTLRSLRSLAVSLRPPALALGLRAALEQLAQGAGVRGFGEVRLALGQADDLGEEVETMVYRVVEEAFEAVGEARSVSVSTQADGSELLIDVEGAQRPIAHERLAVLRARIELVGGTLSAARTELRAVIPLRPVRDRVEAFGEGVPSLTGGSTAALL